MSDTSITNELYNGFNTASKMLFGESEDFVRFTAPLASICGISAGAGYLSQGLAATYAAACTGALTGGLAIGVMGVAANLTIKAGTAIASRLK